MPTFKSILFTSLVVGSAALTSTAYAFDASAVLKKESKTSEIFQFFFDFEKEGKKDEAMEVLKYAADHGNSAAQWKLGRIYQTGNGAEKDHLAAFRMFQRIAAQSSFVRPNTPGWQFSGNAFVQLGDYHLKGIHNTIIKPDPVKAEVMYTTAAMVFRHPDAQFKLGRMQVEAGNALGKARQGVRNLGLAYDKGHVGAEALLGYIIFEGEHVKRNPVKGLYMLGNALKRSSDHDSEWIRQIHDEAYSIAHPDDRTQAVLKLSDSSAGLQ